MGAAFIGPALEMMGGAEAAGAAGGAAEGLGAAGGAAEGGGLGQALKGLNPAQFLGGGGKGGGPIEAANAGLGFINAAASAIMGAIPGTGNGKHD